MSELPKEYLKDLLRSILIEEGFDPESRCDVIHEGDLRLWLSSVYRVTVQAEGRTGTGTKDGNNELSLFFKCFPDNPDIRDSLDADVFFRNEVKFYDQVLDSFCKFQEKRNVNNPFCAAPKCYRANSDGKNDVLVLEDLKPQGFIMLDRLKLMGLHEVQLIMQELGRFHALSLAIKHQEPELFSKIKASVREGVYCERFLKKYGRWYEFVVSDALKMTKHNFSQDSPYFTKLKESGQNICDKMTELVRPKEEDEPYNVITHGDLWVNNFLFHYPEALNEDESACKRKPDKMKILDFQLCRYASPALDVSYVLLCSTDKKTRDNHQNMLLHSYHDSLSQLLHQLGSDPEQLFPYTALEEQLKKYTEFGFWLTVSNLPHTLDEGESIDGNKSKGDTEENPEDSTFTALSAVYSRKSQQCQERILDVIKDVIDNGYLK